MRAGLIAAALFLVPLAAIAQDDDHATRYDPAGDSGLPLIAGLRGSLALNSNASTTVPSTPPNGLRAALDIGGGGSVYVGARLPEGFRVELETLYRYLPVQNVQLGNAASAYFAGGQAHVAAPMVNLLFDLPVPDFPFRPFVGAGLGGAYLTMNAADKNGNDFLRASGWHFAYQFMGGAEIPFNESSRFTAMYRWLQTDGVNGKCNSAGAASFACSTRLNTQSLDFGLEMDM